MRRTPACAQAWKSAAGVSVCTAFIGRRALSRSTPTALITVSKPRKRGSQVAASVSRE